MSQCVDLLGVEMARLASLYQLNDILKGYRSVMPKGFIDQHAG
jgi:hypothetical protein